VAEHVEIPDAQHRPVAQADAEQHLFRVAPVGVVLGQGALHGHGRLQPFLHVAEDHQKAVAFDLEQESAAPVDYRRVQLKGFVDRLQEMDNAEFRDAARKARGRGQRKLTSSCLESGSAAGERAPSVNPRSFP
jgi:hypothetical protein